jgi:hypothetical protein
MKLSIITLTRNNTSELPALAESLSNLNDKRVVWYIKDNSSEPTEIKFLKGLKEKWDSDIELIVDCEYDKGIYNALNIALTKVDSDFFMIFSPDDKLLVSEFHRLLDELNEAPKDCYHAAALWPEGFSFRNYQSSGVDGVNFKGARAFFPGFATSLVFPMLNFNALGGFRENYKIAGDLDLMLRAGLSDGYCLVYHDFPVGRFGIGGISSKLSLRVLVESYTIYCKYLGIPSAFYLILKILIGRIIFALKFSYK